MAFNQFLIISEQQISIFSSVSLSDFLPFQKSKFGNSRFNDNGSNWLTLLTVSENLSHNFSSLKGEPVWSLALGDDNKNITGERYHWIQRYFVPLSKKSKIALGLSHPIHPAVFQTSYTASSMPCFAHTLLNMEYFCDHESM